MDQEPPPSLLDEIEVSRLGPPLSPRARLRRLMIGVAAVLLALLVVFAGLPTLRQDALALLSARTRTPGLRGLPGADSFFFLPTPPWVSVLVDGRPPDPLPVADDHPLPLHLARGVHTFEWRGTPFLTQRCTLPVPVPFLYEPRGSQACQLLPYPGSPPGYVVQRRESLATLPPGQGSALWAAIADTLRVANGAVIQPGEPYLAPGPLPSGARIEYAQSTLRATLQYPVDATIPWSEPCAVSPGVQPCRFPSQDCRHLCTATPSLAADSPSAERVAWGVAVPVQAEWTLTRSDFTGVSSQLQGPGPGALLALVRITWDGTSWHVTPLFGHTADAPVTGDGGAPVTDEMVCAPP